MDAAKGASEQETDAEEVTAELEKHTVETCETLHVWENATMHTAVRTSDKGSSQVH